MRFTPTPLPGAFVIDIEPREDERGFFARTVSREEFSSHGLNADFVQQSVSWNPRVGTLRGMHYQAAPHQEEKLVRVTQGAVFDVIVDLRRDSPAYCQWFSVELSAVNHRQIYIPKGVAHGFQTLRPDTEVFYQMTVPFHPEAPRGLRWNDEKLAICWPDPVLAMLDGRISEKDLALPCLEEALARAVL